METKELVLRDDEKLVYKDTTVKNELTLYEKLLTSEEFGREPTKGIVIDEDTYLSHLEKIITRDYFPYLNDKNIAEEKLNESKLSPLNNLKNINKEYEATMKTSGKDYDLTNLDIDTYLANFNSDELESFKDIMFKDKKKRLRQLLWMFQQSNYHNTKMLAIKEYSEEFMKLPFAEENKKFEQANLNAVLSDPKNDLMFYAKGNFIHNNRSIEEEKSRFSDNVVTEKAILKENTRLPENFVEHMMQKSAFNMRKAIFEHYENSDHAKILKEAQRVELELLNQRNKNKTGGNTPMVNGYKFVKEPVAEPGVIDPVPIMTWGEIASTPMVLNENKFKIQQTPLREKVAHTLTNKNNEKKTKQKVNMKSIKSNSKTYEFTPNALKLLNSVKRNNTNIFDEPNSSYRDKDNNFLSRKRVGSNVISIKSTVKCKETPKNIN